MKSDNMDIIGCSQTSSEAWAEIFFVRQGKLIGRDNYLMAVGEFDNLASIQTAFIKQFYRVTPYVPPTILTQTGVGEVKESLETFLMGKRGTRVNTERKFFPGYILIKMILNDDTLHIIKNTPKLSGFLGTKGKPSPISTAEANRITEQVIEGAENPIPSVIYEIGEQIKVIDGPFASFNGQVEEIDEEKSRLRVAVSIFGRPTPVELEYSQVEKA